MRARPSVNATPARSSTPFRPSWRAMRRASAGRNMGRSEYSVTRAPVRCAAAIATSTPAAPPPTTATDFTRSFNSCQRSRKVSKGFTASAYGGALDSEPRLSEATS